MKCFRLLPVLLTLAPIAAAGPAAAKIEPPLTTAGPAADGWRAPVWRQVRIEQRFSIRITPGTAAMPPAIIGELHEERFERIEERGIGKCLAIGNIAAVRAGDRNRLLLFLRDQRIISAMLEKRCSARDFYSGFYVERNADGAICTGRDHLQSRSGANCKVRRLDELVATGYRRFP